MVRRWVIRGVCLCLFAGALLVGRPGGARAQEVTNLQTSPKGLFGAGLIGAELGLVVPAAFGLDQAWALTAFPAAGATGGALLGHFLIDQNDHTDLSVAVLAIGIALVVPATVATVALTAYDPSEVETKPPGVVELTRRGSAAQARSTVRDGAGLVRAGPSGWRVRVPAVAAGPAVRPGGGATGAEVRVPVLTGSF